MTVEVKRRQVFCGKKISIKKLGFRLKSGEILFIDTGEVGFMRDTTHREFSESDIKKIADTYHNWRSKGKKYEDIKGFCKLTTLAAILSKSFLPGYLPTSAVWYQPLHQAEYLKILILYVGGKGDVRAEIAITSRLW
jgi:hypothetical protein